MEKSDFQRRVEARRRRQRQEILLVIGGFALLLGTWLWYYFIYIRTPAYAAAQIFDAIARRDSAAVERYVDFSRTLSRGYDDLTEDLFLYDAALTEETRSRYKLFYRDVKPQILEGVEETVRRRVATGEWRLPDGAALTQGRLLGIDFERFLERSQLRNTEVQKVGEFRVGERIASAPMTVRDRHTGLTHTMTLQMEQAADGHWQIVGLSHYRAYLDAIALRQNRDIADYIAATKDIIAEGNARLAVLQSRFHAIAKGAGGSLTEGSGAAMKALIDEEILPTLKARQQALDAVSIPLGAQYLANLRHTSTELAIASWQHYRRGIETQSIGEFNAAATLKKQEIETDLRVTDIIRHNVVSQAVPDIP